MTKSERREQEFIKLICSDDPLTRFTTMISLTFFCIENEHCAEKYTDFAKGLLKEYSYETKTEAAKRLRLSKSSELVHAADFIEANLIAS